MPFTFLAWLLLAIAAAGAFIWVVFLVRMTRMMMVSRSVRDGLDLAIPDGGWPSLSIVVPAHNEEDMIDDCARLLRGQAYDNLEIVFVLDRCTDRTAARLAPHAAADPRIVVVENDSCPDDWAGKCYAARLGARRATGRWLLFTDADTQFDRLLTRASVALALDRDLVLLSMLSTLTFKHRFERIAQLAAAVMLLIMFPVGRSNAAKRPRPFANGQFMLFRRDWYDRVGGHEAVKDALLEDLALARQIHSHAGRSEVLFADGMLLCSMYETLRDFESGWKRIFIEACGRKPLRLRKQGWRMFAFGAALPIIQIGALAAAAAVAATGSAPLAIAMVATVLVGLGAEAAVLLRITARARAPRRAVLYFPLGCLVVARILLGASRDLRRRRPLIWGRKQYVLEPR